MSEPIIKARNLHKYYEIKDGLLHAPQDLKALSGVSFDLFEGQTLAVVGESGCGKSTLARLLTSIESPTSGYLSVDGIDMADSQDKLMSKKLRQTVQMVFQDPFGSLNPRQKVGDIIQEPLLINTELSATERREKALDIMRLVGLKEEHFHRYPHMFSGGQRQRVAIARAIVVNPSLVITDEAVSALDVSVQAQVLNLMMSLQDELGLSYLFISHYIAVVERVSHKVGVMYLGRLVEVGTR